MIQSHLILLTGGIGAGKSMVARALRLMGIEVFDTDYAAKQIMDNNDELRRKISARWGEEIYLEDGTLNRKEVASRIFSDDCERLWLNSQVHGLVKDNISELYSTIGKTMFVECAIPTSSGLYIGVDSIWLVEADESVRLGRACRRDRANETTIRARIQAQKKEFEALPPDITEIIDNNGDIPLLPQITRLLDRLEVSTEN